MIKNKTKNTVIDKDFEVLKGVARKGLGLIGERQPKSVILYTRTGIHTFGLKFPIDILILDKKGSVKAIKEKLLPNRIYLWNPKYGFVIELREGTVKNSRTEVGDIIEIKL